MITAQTILTPRQAAAFGGKLGYRHSHRFAYHAALCLPLSPLDLETGLSAVFPVPDDFHFPAFPTPANLPCETIALCPALVAWRLSLTRRCCLSYPRLGTLYLALSADDGPRAVWGGTPLRLLWSSTPGSTDALWFSSQIPDRMFWRK